MNRFRPYPENKNVGTSFWHNSPLNKLTLLALPILGLSGCVGLPPPQLHEHFANETNAQAAIQEKISVHGRERLPVGMFLVLPSDSPDYTPALTASSWSQFLGVAKVKVQDAVPVTMKEAVMVEEIPSGEGLTELREIGQQYQFDTVLVVLPSSREVRGPAQFDVLPEVSLLNGENIEHHASVELGLVDLKSGRLLWQTRGMSFATLERLDVPLASNRFPRVRGSSMVNPIFPEENQALETVRMVALDEALDQAVMKLSEKWHQSPSMSALSGHSQG